MSQRHFFRGYDYLFCNQPLHCGETLFHHYLNSILKCPLSFSVRITLDFDSIVATLSCSLLIFLFLFGIIVLMHKPILAKLHGCQEDCSISDIRIFLYIHEFLSIQEDMNGSALCFIFPPLNVLKWHVFPKCRLLIPAYVSICRSCLSHVHNGP